MNRAYTFTAVALGLFFWATPSAAQFSVQPVDIDLRLDSGSVSRSITVRNSGTEVLDLQLFVEDFDQSEEGGHAFTTLGSMPWSCRDRIRVFPAQMRVEPGNTAEFLVEMDAGSATCWNVIWVQTTPPPVTGGAAISYRIGVKVYGMVSGTLPDGELVEAMVVSMGEGPDDKSEHAKWGLFLSLANRGNAVMRPGGRIEIQDSAGELVMDPVVISSFSVLPGRERKIVIPLPAQLPAGDLVIIPVLDYGGDYLLAARIIHRFQ